MATTIADLSVRVSAETSGLTKALSAAHDKVQGFAGMAQRSASPVSGFFGTFLKGASQIGLASIGIGALVGAVSGLVSGMLAGNAQMEQYNTQFEVLTGSATNATKLMGDLRTMAAKTPFEFPDLAGATQTLLAFGVAQKDIIPDLQMLGDISGGNKEKLNSLSLVFGQVASNGHLMGQDLLQMINAGFNPLNEIAKATGRSMEDLRSDMSNGQISFDQVHDAMVSATSAGGMFNGMMEKQSHTFSGLISTIQDNLGAAQRSLFQGIFDQVKPILEALTSPEVVAGINNLATSVGQTLGQAFAGIVKVVQDVGPGLQTFATTVGDAFTKVQPVLLDIWNIISNDVAPVIGTLIDTVLKVLPGVIDGITASWEAMKPVVEAVAGAVGGALQVGLAWIGDNGEAVGFAIGVMAAAMVTFAVASGAAAIAVGALQLVFSPVVLAIAAIIAVLALFKTAWDNNFLGLQTQITTAVNQLGAVLEWLGETMQNISDSLASSLNSLSNALTQTFNDMSNKAAQFANDLSDTIAYMANHIGDLVSAMMDIMQGRYQDGMAKLLALAADGASQIAAKHQEAGEQASANLADGMASKASDVWKTVTDITSQSQLILNDASGQSYFAGVNIMTTWGNGLVDAGNWAITAVVNIYNKVAAVVGATQKAAASVGGGKATKGLTVVPGYDFSGEDKPPPGFQGVFQSQQAVSQAIVDKNNEALQKKLAAQAATGKGGGGGGGGGAKKGSAGGKATDPQKAAIDAIKAMSDVTKQVSDAVTQGLGTITQLMGFTVPQGLAGAAQNFGAAINVVMQAIQTEALKFKASGLEAVRSFSETASSMFQGLTAGFEFFTALANDGDKILNGPTKLAALATQLVQKVVIVVNVLGGMIPLWDEFAANKIKSFAEASKAVFEGLTTALGFFRDLAGDGDKILNGPARLASLASQLVEKVVIVMNVMGGMIPLWDEFGAKKITQFANASKAVFEGLSSALGFFRDLADGGDKVLNGPARLASLAAQLVEKVVITMNVLGGMIPLWAEFSTTKITQFANATGAVFDGLGKAFTFFQQIVETGQKVLFGSGVDLGLLAEELARKLVYTMNVLGAMIPLWNGDFATKISEFGQATGTVFQGLSTAFDFFQKIADAGKKVLFGGAGDLGVIAGELAQKMVYVMNVLGAMIPDWTHDFDTKIAEFATAAGSVMQGLSSAFDLLKALGEPNILMPTQAAMDSLVTNLVQMTERFRNAVLGVWVPAAMKTTADLATSMGTIMQGLLSAVGTLTAMKDFTGVPQMAIDAFFDSLDRFLIAFGAKAQSWQAGAYDKVAVVAQAIGTIATALGSVVDPLLKIMGFETPGKKPTEGATLSVVDGALTITGLTSSSSGIDAFFDALSAFLTEFAARATAFAASATKDVQAAATAIGAVMDGIGKAVQPITDLAGFVGPSQEQIGAFFNTLTLVVNAFVTATQGMDTSWGDAMKHMGDAVEEFARRAREALGSIPGVVLPPGSSGGGGNNGGGGGGGGGGGDPWPTTGGYGNTKAGNTLVIQGGVTLQDGDLHRHFVRAVPHKYIRGRGPEVGPQGVY